MYRELLEHLLEDDVPPAVEDGRWLLEYRAAGEPHGEPLILSLGETWQGPPPEMIAALNDAPSFTHGYQLSAHGLPRLRRVLARILAADHRLQAGGLDGLRLAVTWSGTRAVMADFAKLVARRTSDTREPVVLCPAPGWDYAGVFEPHGFKVLFLDLDPANGFRPVPGAVQAALDEIDSDPGIRLAAVVVNAQNNPTGVDQGESEVGALIDVAAERQAALLIDDAHYWLHDPQTMPTSALAQVLTNRSAVPWLQVRSLGKQFSCNGWGIGSLLGPPAIVDQLVRETAHERAYNGGGHLQWALAEYLDGPAWQGHCHEKRVRHAAKLGHVKESLHTRMGYPEAMLIGGDCAPFLLVPVPKAYQGLPNGTRDFRRDCFWRTGVMLTDGWPVAREFEHEGTLPYVRIYTGPDGSVISDALDRMANSGIHYLMTASHKAG